MKAWDVKDFYEGDELKNALRVLQEAADLFDDLEKKVGAKSYVTFPARAADGTARQIVWARPLAVEVTEL